MGKILLAAILVFGFLMWVSRDSSNIDAAVKGNQRISQCKTWRARAAHSAHWAGKVRTECEPYGL